MWLCKWWDSSWKLHAEPVPNMHFLLKKQKKKQTLKIAPPLPTFTINIVTLQVCVCKTYESKADVLIVLETIVMEMHRMFELEL